jgi:uncharacterized membrane protein
MTDEGVPDQTATATAGPPAWRPVAGMMLVSGVLHLVAPKPYESLIPKELGAPRPWVTWSGVAELAIGVGLAVPRTRRVAGLASAVLLAGVFPGNLEMTRRALTSPKASLAWKAASVARLPFQYPPVRQSLRIWRAPRGTVQA